MQLDENETAWHALVDDMRAATAKLEADNARLRNDNALLRILLRQWLNDAGDHLDRPDLTLATEQVLGREV